MPGPTNNDVRTDLIDQVGKSIWWTLFFGSSCFCFYHGCWGYVALKSDPPLLKAFTTFVSLVLYLLGPIYLNRIGARRYREFTADFAARLARVEAIIDPGRTSTGLLEDGTDPKPGTNP